MHTKKHIQASQATRVHDDAGTSASQWAQEAHRYYLVVLMKSYAGY